MGILKKVKSTASKILKTAKAAVAKVTGGGTGGGGGSSWSAPKVTNTASVIQSKAPTPTKVSVPAGPQSKLPTTAPKINMPTLPAGPQSKNVNPALNKYATPDVVQSITGKPATPKSTSSKSSSTKSAAPQSMLPGTPGGMSYDPSQLSRTSSSASTADAGTTDPALLSYIDYSLADGSVFDGATTIDSAPATSESSTATIGGTTSTSKSGGGAGGSTTTTSSRGSDTQSSAQQAMQRSDKLVSMLQGILKEKQDELAKLLGQEESAADEAISSDTTETKDEDAAMKQLKEEPDDSALTLLDEELDKLRDNLRQNESVIGGAYDVKKSGMEGEQAGETGQASASIAAAGGYLGFSGSAQGVMLSLAESHRAELVALESERQQALQEARNAAANRRFDLVRLKAAEIARIDQEKYERTKEYNAEVKKEADKTKEEAKKLRDENSIFTAIKGGAKTLEDIFDKLGGRVPMETITDVLDGITKSSSAFGAKFKLSTANTASLIGAGMSAADVATFNEYVNENGYTDELRNTLTPLERAAADKIFRDVPKGSDLTKPMSVLDLNRISERYGIDFPYGVTNGEVEEFLQDNFGASPEDMQAAIDMMFGADERKKKYKIDFTEAYIRDTLSDEQLKKLADKVGASKMFTGATEDIKRMFSTPAYMETLKDLIDDARDNGYEDAEILEYLAK